MTHVRNQTVKMSQPRSPSSKQEKNGPGLSQRKGRPRLPPSVPLSLQEQEGLGEEREARSRRKERRGKKSPSSRREPVSGSRGGWSTWTPRPH